MPPSFGYVMDLLDDRYLDLQDVVGQVEPVPALVPLPEYQEHALLYKNDSAHEVFLAVLQNFTDCYSGHFGKESWTWLVQWDVVAPVVSPTSNTGPVAKRPRIEGPLTSLAPERSDMEPPVLKPPVLKTKPSFLDPELLAEEELLRILIDIVQAPPTLVPNFVEFLYRWVDYYEGDGWALHCALRGQIPSLWDFEYHPIEMPPASEHSIYDRFTKTNLDQTHGQEDCDLKPSLTELEEMAEMTERMTYKEKKYGIQTPKTMRDEEKLRPLVNVPREEGKRRIYYAACFKSRETALRLLLKQNLTMKQINNYVKLQKEHPSQTSEIGDKRGMTYYYQEKPQARIMHTVNQRSKAIRKKWNEMIISRRLAIEARQAVRDATDRSLPFEDAGHVAVPPPLIPATPMLRRALDRSTYPRVWDIRTYQDYWAGIRELATLAAIRVPMHLLDNLESDLAKDIKFLREQMIEDERIGLQDELDNSGNAEATNDGEELMPHRLRTQTVEPERATVAVPSRTPLVPIPGNAEPPGRMETAIRNMTPAQAVAVGSILVTGGLRPRTGPPAPARSLIPLPEPVATINSSLSIPHSTMAVARVQSSPITASSLTSPLQAQASQQRNQLLRPLQHLNASGHSSSTNSMTPSISVQVPTPSLPPPSINRRPPSPIKTNELNSQLQSNDQPARTSTMAYSKGTPVFVYFPRIVDGEGDAIMLGTIEHGSQDISLSHALFLTTSLWSYILRRVRAGSCCVLETYVSPAFSSEVSSAPHKNVYEKLLHAHSFMTSCVDREQDLTKRWKVTKGIMKERNRGAIWEGYGVTVDKALEMSGDERMGALQMRRAIAEMEGRTEEEFMDEDVDDYFDSEDDSDGDEIMSG